MGAFKEFSCQNQQEWKRPTARRRSDREHLPLVLLRSCWCKYKTAQMEIWLQSYLTLSSYKLVWCLAIDFWAAYILSLAFPCHLWILVQQVADSVFCTPLTHPRPQKWWKCLEQQQRISSSPKASNPDFGVEWILDQKLPATNVNWAA